MPAPSLSRYAVSTTHNIFWIHADSLAGICNIRTATIALLHLTLCQWLLGCLTQIGGYDLIDLDRAGLGYDEELIGSPSSTRVTQMPL
jgi:hypothetical protein